MVTGQIDTCIRNLSNSEVTKSQRNRRRQPTIVDFRSFKKIYIQSLESQSVKEKGISLKAVKWYDFGLISTDELLSICQAK